MRLFFFAPLVVCFDIAVIDGGEKRREVLFCFLFSLLLLDLDVLAEPGETFEDACRKRVSMRVLNDELFLVECMRCLPSPLVAQLGSTFQT